MMLWRIELFLEHADKSRRTLNYISMAPNPVLALNSVLGREGHKFPRAKIKQVQIMEHESNIMLYGRF